MENKIKKLTKFISKPKDNYPNLQIFSYHLLKGLQKTAVNLGIIKKNEFARKDMFNWSLYHLHYKGELKEGMKKYNHHLKTGDYKLIDNKLKKIDQNVKPLYFGHHLLYQTILRLNPETVLEVGCGNGVHLYNLQILAPQIKLFGIDLLEKQLNFLYETYPDIKADIKQMDATKPFPADMPKVDLAFTQAVIMHIHEKETHLIALANLFNISNKYIVMAEKWKNHPFMDDIKKLHEQKLINWPNLYFYYQELESDKQPFLMICSKEPLNFPVLEDYKILL